MKRYYFLYVLLILIALVGVYNADYLGLNHRWVSLIFFGLGMLMHPATFWAVVWYRVWRD